MDKALALQAAEYERRLQALNHAHEEMLAHNAEYLPRESYETRHAELERRITHLERVSIENRATIAENRRLATASAVRNSAVIGMVAVLVAVALRFVS